MTAPTRQRPDEALPPRVLRSMSEILDLVAGGGAVTRAALAAELELARSTVSHRVDLLVEAGVLGERPAEATSVGRPPVVLSVDAGAGVLLCAEIGGHHLRVAACSLDGEVLAWRRPDVGGTRWPDPLEATDRLFDEVLADAGRTRAEVIGIGATVASPVDVVTGDVLRPPFWTHWSPAELREFLAARHPGAAVVIENDANAMAVGEAHLRGLDAADLVFVKLGVGIGCGILSHGRLHRGATWCAGDVGHTRRAHDEGTRCRCGGIGCLESRAAGWALTERLQADGLDVASTDDVIEAALSTEPAARLAVRAAGREIGDVLASAVSFFNPSHLVLGGELARLEADLLAEIRGAVYQWSVPLTTRSLAIEPSADADRVGLAGIAVLLRRHVLSPVGLPGLLAGR